MSWWAWFSGEVLAVLDEALAAASADIERELDGTQRLAWRYTAVLERRFACDIDTEINTDMCTQALYNLRQHEAFLKIILVSFTAVQI